MRLEILNDKATRPYGNPFDVKPVEILGYGTFHSTHWVVDTGIKIVLEKDIALNVTSLVEDVFIVSWSWTMLSSLKIIVKVMSDEATKLIHGMETPFARVSIIEQRIVPVRFVEFAKEGGRLITGEPKEVKDV